MKLHLVKFETESESGFARQVKSANSNLLGHWCIGADTLLTFGPMNPSSLLFLHTPGIPVLVLWDFPGQDFFSARVVPSQGSVTEDNMAMSHTCQLSWFLRSSDGQISRTHSEELSWSR